MHGGEPGQCGLNLWVRKVKKASWERSLKKLQLEHDGVSSTGGQETEEEEEEEWEERYINLGAKNSAPMQAGDRIIIMTPGGGAWGKEGEPKALAGGDTRQQVDAKHAWKKGSHAAREELALQA
jgi:5-oxoprolinase (ATP-hydrolysing)